MFLGAPKEHLEIEQVKEPAQELTAKAVEEKTTYSNKIDIQTSTKRIELLEKIIRAVTN